MGKEIYLFVDEYKQISFWHSVYEILTKLFCLHFVRFNASQIHTVYFKLSESYNGYCLRVNEILRFMPTPSLSSGHSNLLLHAEQASLSVDFRRFFVFFFNVYFIFEKERERESAGVRQRGRHRI